MLVLGGDGIGGSPFRPLDSSADLSAYFRGFNTLRVQEPPK